MKRVINALNYRIKLLKRNLKSVSKYFKYLKEYKNAIEINVEPKKSVVFYFQEKSVVSLSFAYYFPLLIGFAQNGYDVFFHMSLRFHAQINNQTRLLFSTNGIFLKKITLKDIGSAEIIISDNKIPHAKRSQRFILYNPDIIDRKLNPLYEIVQPFFMHPLQLLMSKPKAQENRKIKIFFSGNAGSFYYNKPVLGGMMNRFEILSHLKKTFPDSLINSSFSNLQNKEKFSLVIQDWSWNQKEGGIDTEYRIPTGIWLSHLSNCDFFLSPPGVNIPFSHNLIESMSVGAIPITNYGHLLSPPLENNIHCLSFQNKEDLEMVVKRAIDIDQESIDKMRRNVMNYYSQHLDPKNFVSKLVNDSNVKTIYYYATKLSQQKFNSRANNPNFTKK